MRDEASPDLGRTPEDIDWVSAERSLDAHGNAVLPGLMTAAQCDDLAARYDREDGYRARIVMARHGFGRGEYKYFAYPLPPLLEHLRHAHYPRLATVANRWSRQLGSDVQYPDDLDSFLQRCHRAGQRRPTPLILQYGEGDYNCLHQDLYGEHVFPLQLAILLSDPGRDFAGGEFVMTERSSQGQRVEVVALGKGDAVVFTVNQRPAMSSRGNRKIDRRKDAMREVVMRKVAMRHGVSRIHRGRRHTVGLIFHDAK